MGVMRSKGSGVEAIPAFIIRWGISDFQDALSLLRAPRANDRV
jgi:hypothetical protein